MIRNKKTLRAIAFFFLINMLSSIFLPSFLFANSSSPSMPEYTSFLSASNTNMVDLQTGDFKYNVPLLDVPGPEGSYPINLFYQAGIKTEQDASWVGLGWNINVGAINRYVDGFADDYSGANYVITQTGQTTEKIDEPLGISEMVTGWNSQYEYSGYKYGPLSTTQGTAMYGALQTYASMNGTATPTDLRSLDSYAMNDPSNKDFYTNHNPEKVLGGSMPAYDVYTVSGQGLQSLQGEIQPVNLENGSLFRQKLTSGSTIIKDFNIDKVYTQPKLQFRYVNDFSNSFKAVPTNFSVNTSSASLNLGSNGLGYSYSVPDANGLNTTNMRLAGSRHIEYYTNGEISGMGGPSTALANGFIKYRGLTDASRILLSYTNQQTNATYAYNVGTQVGGFSVTDETGVTYFYALPVYTYESYKNYDASWKTTGVTSRTVSCSQAYAYSWLLTAVTGPDFIDINKNGYADEGDNGSWTVFNYGKLTDQYIFRSPYSGHEVDVDGAHIYSSGRKEIYYLDAVITRSHTALFQKNSDRLDGKGVTDPSTGGLGIYSKGLMRLEKIFLHRNEDIQMMATNASQTYISIFDAVNSLKTLSNSSNTTLSKVFDSYDLAAISNNTLNNYSANVLKQINFSCDYSLCQGVPNNSSTATNVGNSGKLTLNSVSFYGPNHSKTIPSVDFTYDVTVPKSHTITNVFAQAIDDPGSYYPKWGGGITMGSANTFQVGDIIKFTNGTNVYYAFLAEGYDQSGITNYGFAVVFLGPNGCPGAGTYTAYETKNPPYTADVSDYWGYLKGDYTGDKDNYTSVRSRMDLYKRPSLASSKGIDAWSLRKIKTSLNGTIEISYEADSYVHVGFEKKIVLNCFQNQLMYTNSAGTLTTDNFCYYNPIGINPLGIFKFSIIERNGVDFLNQNFYVGQKVKVSSLATITYPTGAGSLRLPYPITESGTDMFEITEIGSDNTMPGSTEGNDFIKGHFITPTPAPASYIGYFKNPLISHCFGDLNPALNLSIFHNGSYITMDHNMLKYGGGIRVKKIKISEGTTSEFYETVYEYNDPATQLSSGTTSYEPTPMTGLMYPGFKLIYGCSSGMYETDSLNPVRVGHTSYFKSAYGQYYNNYLGNFKDLIALNREIPSPGVLYEYVTKKEYANGVQKQGIDQYKFKIFNMDMVRSNTLFNLSMHSLVTGATTSTATINIINQSSQVGKLLENKTYDLSGSLISKSTYEYAVDLPKGQGVLDEVFHEHRKFNVGTASEYAIAVVVNRSQYPCVLLNTETIDYLKGNTYRVENKTFDFYSGKLLENQTFNTYGNVILNSIKPAYTAYPEMGIKLNNYKNRNMLFQEAANYSFKMKDLLCNAAQNVTSPVVGTQLTMTNGTLPLFYSVGSSIEVRGFLPANGGMMSKVATISYIAADRLSIIINGISAFPTSPILRVKDSPLSVKINSWNNSWNYRNYNTTLSQYSNTLTVDDATTVQDERVWRPYRNYVWSSAYLNSDGSFKNSNGTGSFSDFDWSAETSGGIQSSPYWIKSNESTLYDKYSNLLEVKDLNGNYVSGKKGYNQSYTLASATNSNNASFAYTSFEDLYSPVSGTTQFGGEILAASNNQAKVTGGGTLGPIKPHTGKYMISVAGATVSLFSARYNVAVPEGNIIRGKKYRASVWVHKNSDANAGISVSITSSGPTYSYSGSAIKQNSQINAGDWYLVNLDFDIPSTYNSVLGTSDKITVSCTTPSGTTSYFDDFMVRPIDASITCNVYDALTKRITHVIDNDGFYSRNEYDDSGKLIATYKETLNGEKKVNSFLYNFAKP